MLYFRLSPGRLQDGDAGRARRTANATSSRRARRLLLSFARVRLSYYITCAVRFTRLDRYTRARFWRHENERSGTEVLKRRPTAELRRRATLAQGRPRERRSRGLLLGEDAPRRNLTLYLRDALLDARLDGGVEDGLRLQTRDALGAFASGRARVVGGVGERHPRRDRLGAAEALASPDRLWNGAVLLRLGDALRAPGTRVPPSLPELVVEHWSASTDASVGSLGARVEHGAEEGDEEDEHAVFLGGRGDDVRRGVWRAAYGLGTKRIFST